VIPFQNGQVELETAQLNLNGALQVQFQARVIVNWGKIFARGRRKTAAPAISMLAPWFPAVSWEIRA
jgi:hypothetical protein